MVKILEGLKKELPEIRRNVLLKDYTGYRVGGPAKYFFEAKNKNDFKRAILAARKLKLPFFVLGGGYNVLVSDKGYNGLIIKTADKSFSVKKKNGWYFLECGVGLFLSMAVKKSIGLGLSGLEWAAGIPGTVGGSVYGNAAAFDGSICDSLESALAFDCLKKKTVVFKNKKCFFAYRQSFFKKNKNFVILSAVFRLKKGDKKAIKKEVDEKINYRKKNHPLEFPSCGSVFKNLELNTKKNIALGKKFFRANPQFAFFEGKSFIPAGMINEAAGLRGKVVGGAQLSQKHANFIISLKNAKAKDVVGLIKLAKKKAKDEFGIILNEEIQYLGF